MTRKSYNIDIKKPAFPFGQEFWPNKAEPVASGKGRALTDNITALDMQNVLPTPSGYSSFFGTIPLGGLKLPPITEKVFTYKDSLGNNTLIALGAYGAMFSNDGVTWNYSEVPTQLTQTATGTYEFQPDMTINYIGFASCVATFTKASTLANATLVEATPQPAGANTQDVISLPVSATNTYFKAEFVTAPYDEAEAFDRLVEYINPGITNIIAGNTYVMVNAATYSTYTAVQGDTVQGVLFALIVEFNGHNTGVFAEYLTDSRVKLWATTTYSTTSLEYTTMYEVPANGLLPIPTVGFLANGLIPTGWTQSAGANASWLVKTDQVNSGTYSLGSDAITNGQSAAIEFIASITANLQFNYFVSSETSYDFFKVYRNGVAQVTASGNTGIWALANFPVVAGDVIKFEYKKDPSISQGLDAAWIDNVELPPAAAPVNTLVGTLNNDQIPVTIPVASKGNLGYVVFKSASNLTSGKFNIRRAGMYQVGGAPVPTGTTIYTNGSIDYTNVNKLLGAPYAMPLTEVEYVLRQYSGATQTGFTAEIWDSGLPLSSVSLGSRSLGTVQRVNCALASTDVVTGRVFILQSKGQLGSYTALAADGTKQILSGVIAAYNLAGAAVATPYVGQIILSTATDELFFQPAALTTMTASGTNSAYRHIVDFKLTDNLVTSDKLGKLYSLQFNVTVPSTNILYTIYSDGSPVPVTTTTGAWSDANFEFTSAQIAAANLANTPLMVRINGKHLVMKARSGGIGSVIGGYGFRFRAILTNGANMSLHVGPIAGLINTAASIVADTLHVYTKNSLTGAYRKVGVIDASLGLAGFSPYQETSTPVVGIITTGLTPNAPITDVFQFSAPVDKVARITGYLVDLQDVYTPNTVIMYGINPVSGISGAVTNALHLPRVSIDYALAVNKTELVTFGIFNPWTTAIIKNRLYCYRNGQGVGTYILRLLANGTGWERLTPTFANMAQIEGITSARGRMVLWDTTGSVYTSSVIDPVDFTPSLKTRANVSKVDAVRGNIVLCLGFKDGYIIYSTASIILAKYVGDTTTFKYFTLSNEQGVLNTKAVTVVDDSMQFAYTQAGLFAVSEKGLQEISPDASSYLKSSKLSPRLDFLENRYLSIAFAPEQPSWVVSKWEKYTGTTIKSLSGLLGSTILANSAGLPADTGYYTVSVDIPAPLHIPANSGTYGIDSGLGTLYLGATMHSFSEPAYNLTTLQDYIDWANRSTGVPGFTGYDGLSFTIPGKADLEVWAIDGHLNFVNVIEQIGGWGWMLYKTFTDVYDTPNGSFIFPTIVPVQTVVLRVKSNEFTALNRYIIDNQIELARIQAFITHGYSPITGITSNHISGLNLMWYLGKLYAWGYVTLKDWQGNPILDTHGNPAPKNVTLSRYPALIGTNPLATLMGILTALGVGGPVAPLTTPDIPPVPDIVIPGGQFIATQGTAEPVDPIYTKALLLDTSLKNWGSCDVPFRNLIDFIPINERSLNPITGALTTKFTYQNLAKAIAIMLQDGTLNLCTTNNALSEITFGDIGFTNTGVTRFLDAIASFTQETGTMLTLEGSRDGERLSPILTSSALSQNGHILLNKVLTGKWFRLKVSGRFDIKSLKFSGEAGGTR